MTITGMFIIPIIAKKNWPLDFKSFKKLFAFRHPCQTPLKGHKSICYPKPICSYG